MNAHNRLLLVAALISGAAGFASFHAWRGIAASPVVRAGTMAAVTPDIDAASTADTDAEAHTEVPQQVPDLSLPDLEGRPHALRSFAGHPTIFNFWASWCAPCRREIPLLNEIQRNGSENGVQIVGIAADLRANIVDFLKQVHVDYRVLVGEREGSEAAARFGVSLVLPFSVFVSSAGQVVAVKVGELHRDEAVAMLAAIHELDTGKRDLGSARQQIATRLRELAVERARGREPAI